MSETLMRWEIGIDVGGTFTDFFALDTASGEVRLHKRPSTPSNPADAIIHGLKELCAAAGIEAPQISRIIHGTTVATNALIQRRGGRVAVITTRGFRDLLEIGRQIGGLHRLTSKLGGRAEQHPMEAVPPFPSIGIEYHPDRQ